MQDSKIKMKEAAQEEEVYHVEAIIGKKIKQNGTVMYKVLWEGWDEKDSTWEPIRHVAHCVEQIKDYEERNKRGESYKRESKDPDTEEAQEHPLSEMDMRVLSRWVKERLEPNPYSDLNSEEIQEIMQEYISTFGERGGELFDENGQNL